MVRILVAESPKLVNYNSARTLERQSDFEIVGLVATALEVESQVARLRPDVLLLDLKLTTRIAHLLSRICQKSPQTRILIVTDEFHMPLQRILDQGAHGILVRSEMDDQDVVKAIWQIQDSPAQPFLPRSILEHLQFHRRSDKFGSGKRLAANQWSVVQLLAETKKVKTIAREMQISPKTVYCHIDAACAKLGVKGIHGLRQFLERNPLNNSLWEEYRPLPERPR